MDDWDGYFMVVARAVASKSKDPSTKVGALVVDPSRVIRASGFNGFPRGVLDLPERLADREKKLTMVVHAEMNAICNAARVGVPLEGCSIYVTLHPCSRCAGLIAQAGVRQVVCPDEAVPERWAADFALAKLVMNEAGVAVRTVRVGPALVASAALDQG